MTQWRKGESLRLFLSRCGREQAAATTIRLERERRVRERRQLREGEETFLRQIEEYMHLEPEVVKAIRAVMLIKNRY